MGTMQIELNSFSFPRKFARFCSLIGLCLFALAIPAAAQVSDPPDTIRIDSDLVNLQVSVLGQNPLKPPTFLQPRDFAVIDDGTPQEITFFATAEAPFDLVLLLDLSNSTSKKLKLIRKSAKRFVDACRPTDRIAVVTFSEDLEVVSPLTTDRKELKQDIDDMERLSSGTNFWDALRFVHENVINPSARRTAIVIMTDGVDNALPEVPGPGSQTTFEDLVSLSQRSEALAFPIFLDTELEEVKKHHATTEAYVAARAQLAQLAEISGTSVRKASKLEDLETIYKQIITDLGTVYSIGYRPANISRDGKWHQVTVNLVDRPDLAARTRSGYFAASLASASPKPADSPEPF